MSLVFDPTSQILSQMIQGTALRHRVLAANLANAETPGYEAQDVTFSAALEDAQHRGSTNDAVAPRVETTVTSDGATSVRRDGNTVDLDRQMVALAQNTQWHNTMLQILAGRFTMLRTAIKG